METDSETMEILKLILAAVGLIVTILTLRSGIKRFKEEKIREFQKSFFESQLEIYKKAVAQASGLNIHPRGSATFNQHLAEYGKLFIGQMCIIEDKGVEGRMVQFNQILQWYLTSKNDKITNVLKSQLWHFSLVLAHTCRNSSIETWHIEKNVLGELFNDYSKSPLDDETRIEICEELVNRKIEPELAASRLTELDKNNSSQREQSPFLNNL